MVRTRRLPRVSTGQVTVVLAAAALFFALDVPTHAAGLITGKDIQNNSVAGKDIKDKSLTGNDVKDDSLIGADVSEGTLDKVPFAGVADTAKAVTANSVTGAGITDHSLKAADFAVAAGTATADIPSVAINDCTYDVIDTNVDLTGATVVITGPQAVLFSSGGLSLHTTHSNIPDSFRVVACNLTGAAIDPPSDSFDYVAFK